jgi:hypothetical protein
MRVADAGFPRCADPPATRIVSPMIDRARPKDRTPDRPRRKARNRRRAVVVALAVAAGTTGLAACGDDGSSSSGTPQVVTGAGDVTGVVDRYRALLGDDNGGVPTSFADGRREVNWDGVPDEFAAPAAYPPDFFNAPQAPRARGLVLGTPGDHLAVSAAEGNASGAAPRFGDVNPSYADRFDTFSAPRLFSPIGSNVVDLHFYVPGTHTAAVSRGFGAVYTSVDQAETASFELFDRDDASLGTFAVPVSKDGLSFLGIAFDEPTVARVRIVYGNTKLGPDDGDRYDVAVMDDFIFGEPRPAD